MPAITLQSLDSTDVLPLPDYTAEEYANLLEKYFRSKHPLQLPFYDTPQGAIFRNIYSKKIQIKRRILEYCAKY